MVIISFMLFFICYRVCFYNRKAVLGIAVFLFAGVFLYTIFGAYFLSFTPDFNLNILVFLSGIIYFYFWFFSFFVLSRFGILGIVLHSLGMVLIIYVKIIFPLHPFILLYPYAGSFLPATGSAYLNIFFLFILSGVMFCKCNRALRIITLLVPLLFFSGTNAQVRETARTDIKIAVVQVGLYFYKGGNTTDFFSELKRFLDHHPDVSVVAFSENNFFSYKTDYNKEMSENLLYNIKESKLDDKYHLFLSFSGFRSFNNIVTLYRFSGSSMINQKKTLIPFIEKPGLFNSVHPISSEFYSVDSNHSNSIFYVQGHSISTHICYDVLFPDTSNMTSDIILIQSNYALLDSGAGFERLQRIATFLAKFTNGLQSKLVINIQNTGGTVVLSDQWKINNEIFERSKNAPFLSLIQVSCEPG